MKSVHDFPCVNDIISFPVEGKKLNIYLVNRTVGENKGTHHYRDLDLKYSGEEYEWNTAGQIAGEYFVEWENKSYYFYLGPNESFPEVYTNKYNTQGKYEVLIERLLPRVYKYFLSDKDITPEVLKALNSAIVSGMANLEDLLYGLFDIYSLKTDNDFILQLLARFTGRKLKGNSPHLWKIQTKESINLNKKKGTLEGLELSLAQIGVKLLKFTKLWQIASPYYWTEVFKIKSERKFPLYKAPIGEYKIYLNGTELPKDYVSIDLNHLIWKGEIELFEGDSLKITYQTQEKDNLSDYIDGLDFANSRNENIKLIEEGDLLFDTIIKERHPFYEPITYGKIRTVLLFSENIYNMDAYNGSLRDSKSPCDMDENFSDECGYCQSSKFNIDVEVNELSNSKLRDIQEVIEENVPFHSLVHNINIYGKTKDYLLTIKDKIGMSKEDSNKDKLSFSDRISCKVE